MGARSWLAVIGSILLWAGASIAQPTPSCPGDCDLDGEVKIDELLRGVNFALAGQPAVGCDELDDNRDGLVSVNELIRAVLKALLGCRLEGQAAAEAAARAALGVVESLQVIDLGRAGAGGGGSAALRAAVGDPGRGVDPCKGSGSLSETCTVKNGVARLDSKYKRCRLVITGSAALVLDGEFVRTVAAPKFCDTRTVPPGVEAVDELRDLRRQLVTTAGTVVSELRATLRTRSVEMGTGCDTPSGSEILDGTLAFMCRPDPVVADSCPPEGIDIALTARDLMVVRDSTTSGNACQQASTLIGRLESRDRVSGLQYDAVYRQFLVRRVPRAAGGDSVRLDGALGVDCLGEIVVTTEKPLLQAANARCPTSGLLLIDLPRGAPVAADFGREGLALDVDGDGNADVDVESCEDRSLAQCS
jgi:hypothetical protein